MNAFLTSPLFYGIYIFIMVGLFFYFLMKNLLPYHQAKREAEQLNEFLLGLPKENTSLQKASAVKEWLDESNQNQFIKQFVKPSFAAFHAKLYQNQQKGITLVPDIYDYFLEDYLMQKVGKRKLVETIPGLFLSMGIIGTFMGIAVGVSQLDPGGSAESMQNGISVLLSGMKVKFTSSIFGILLSVIWQFIDKMFFYPKLSESFYNIRQQLDETFPTQEQNTVLYQMLSNQEKQMLDFQSFITEMMIPKMVTGMTEAIQQTVAPQMEQTQSMIQEMISKSRDTQLDGMEMMVDKFVSSLNEVSGDHMKNLGDALSTTIEWQQTVQNGMSTLVESMEKSANEQALMAEKTTSLTNAVHQYTDKFFGFESLMESNISLMNETFDKNNELHTNITSLLQTLKEERNDFSHYLEKNYQNMSVMVEQTEKQLTLNEKLEENLESIESIHSSQEELYDHFTQSLELAHKSNQELFSIVESLKQTNEIQSNLQNELNASMHLIIEEKTDVGNMVTNLNDQLISQLADMDHRIEHLSEVWESTSATFTAANKHLATSMNQFTDDMHRGLEHTFEQFDEELSKSVRYLSKAVHAIHEGIVDLPDSIQVLNTSVSELNKQAKLMVKSN